MTDHLKLDDLYDLLPALEELAPLLDEVAAASHPDPQRRWSGSGELETLGRRSVRPGELEARIPHLVEEARTRAERIYTGVAAAIRAMAEGDREGAAQALLEVAQGEEASDRPSTAYQYALAAHRAARSLRDRTTATLALRRAADAANERLDEILCAGDQPMVQKVDLSLRNRELKDAADVEALLDEIRTRLLEVIKSNARVRLV